MGKLLKVAGIFMGGWLFGAWIQQQSIEDGDVVYNDEKMYVKASKDKNLGYSYAKVVYKNPEE